MCMLSGVTFTRFIGIQLPVGIALMYISGVTAHVDHELEDCHYHPILKQYIPAAQEVKLKDVRVFIRRRVNGSIINFRFDLEHGRLNIKCPNGTSPSTICCKFECTDSGYNTACTMYVQGSYAWYQAKVSDSQNTTQNFKIYFFFVDSKAKSYPAEISVNIPRRALLGSIGVVMRSYLMKLRQYPLPKYFTNFAIYNDILDSLWKTFTEKLTAKLEPYFIECIEKFYKEKITFLVAD
ncbi:uncharacterized protein LOC142584274 [Dermacentor variabilis]|uniref:uncharacterized protein LOC142584274 n=1 Tax=Dermacentor variabilis TaxID=34621 RepID=UPI003F5B8D40